MTMTEVVARGALRRGSKGPDVVVLQNALRAAGHELVADGDFGSITDTAVRKFQAAHSLLADGVVGPITAGALDVIVKEAPAPAAPLPSTMAVAPWLSVMRALTGTAEIAGAKSNPLIIGWVSTIASVYPDLKPNIGWYVNDDTPWCGLAVAYAVTKGGFKPALAPLYATNWFHAWKDGVKLKEPSVGAIMVMTRDGGGHVTLYEGEDDLYWYGRGGNQSNMINVSKFPKSRPILGAMWPKAAPLPTTGRFKTTFAAAVSKSEA